MSTTTAPMGPADPAVIDEAVATLATAVDGLVRLDEDTLDDDAIGQVLAGAEGAIRRLRAVQAQLANTLSRRRARAARLARPDDPRAPQKAARAVRGELTDRLGITPSKAKQLARTGAQLEHLPATSDACADGRLTAGHARVIDEVTAHFHGDARTRFEAELVELAGRCRDAVVFGRRARRLLIDRDHDAAMADLDRKKARRSGQVTQTETGTTLLRLETAGYEGELVHTVVDAFRTPDATGEHRTAEQRTHDAVVAAFETALRAGAASTQHGVRPHVALTFRADSIRPGDGAAETTWSGPLPYAEVARLLGDCSLTRIVADLDDVPLSVSRQVRTVPMGLWRLLVHRDGGCIVVGCDAPAGWCQVAHLGDWYVAGGRLAPDTAGLLCTAGSNHHAHFDNGDHPVVWNGGRPTVNFGARRGATQASGTDEPLGTDGSSGTDGPTSQGGLFAREDRGHYRRQLPTAAAPDLPTRRSCPRPRSAVRPRARPSALVRGCGPRGTSTRAASRPGPRPTAGRRPRTRATAGPASTNGRHDGPMDAGCGSRR